MSEATGRVLSGAQVRALSQPSDLKGALRLAFHLALVAVGVWAVAWSGPWTLVPAMLFLGVAQASLFAPIHETMHLTAFASRRVNAVVGWLSACPSLLNWHFYGVFHLAHHRYTQDPERDPELAVLPEPRSVGAYVRRVSALPYWRARWQVLRDAWRGDMSAYSFIPERAVAKVVFSVRAMSLFVLFCAGLSMLLVGWWAPLAFWLGPQLLGQPFLRLYLLAEHTLCTMDANGLTNTRTTYTTALMRLVMWNMSYHAEHHLYPSIPFHRLPAAHVAIKDRLGVIQDGYIRWHVAFVGGLKTVSPKG